MTNALKKRGTPKIPLIDLNAQYRSIQPEIDEAIQRVIESSGFILGREVEAFEHEFAAFVGSKHGTGVSSGTAALHLTLLACGVRLLGGCCGSTQAHVAALRAALDVGMKSTA